MSRERFRQLLLKVTRRALLGSRTIRFVMDAARAAVWRRFMRRLNTGTRRGARLHPGPARASLIDSSDGELGTCRLPSVLLGKGPLTRFAPHGRRRPVRLL